MKRLCLNTRPFFCHTIFNTLNFNQEIFLGRTNYSFEKRQKELAKKKKKEEKRQRKLDKKKEISTGEDK